MKKIDMSRSINVELEWDSESDTKSDTELEPKLESASDFDSE